MKFIAAAVFLVSTSIVADAQGRHPCAKDAIAKATPLLRLHFGYEPGQKAENFSIGDEVRVLPPAKALKGKGRLDVLEVRGYIYKAEYRMRFIYVQNKSKDDTCALMGQEILEDSNPY